MFDIPEMRRKAEEGLCPSQCMLGLCYLYGIDVEIDYQEAFRFLSLAAEQRASRAWLHLGKMYAQGLGVERNIPEAIRRFEAVAGPSDSSDAFLARVELGRLYSQGQNIVGDEDLALKWYSLALEVSDGFEDWEEVQEAHAYVERAGHSPQA